MHLRQFFLTLLKLPAMLETSPIQNLQLFGKVSKWHSSIPGELKYNICEINFFCNHYLIINNYDIEPL